MPEGDYEEEPTREELLRVKLEDTLRYGLSQRQFSSITGVPRSTLGDFLRETHAPTEATLDRIEFALLGTGPLAAGGASAGAADEGDVTE